MKKQEILKVISDARSAHEAWIDQGPFIADAINLDGLIEPSSYDESDLYTWLKKNKSSISAFEWFKELEQVHVQAHYSYSDLFENATRKYNPKTRDELLEEFKIVKTDVVDFNNKLDQIEDSISKMSDSVYLDYVLKSNAVSRKFEVNQDKPSEIIEEQSDKQITTEADNTIESVNDANTANFTHIENSESETEEKQENTIDSKPLSNNTDEMKTIDIVEFEDNDESKNQQDTSAKSVVDNIEAVEQESVIDNAKLANEYQQLKTGLNSTDTLEKHIALKEQNINRLIKEKELSEQELSHLEETQKLSQQGLDQLEQHLQLKQEENELEQLDSEKLLETNTIERDKTKQQLDQIEAKKQTLKNELSELEQENAKDVLIQEEYENSPQIEKQFDSLKNNKIIEVDELKKQLSTKNSDLMQLKQQVMTLEAEVTDIENDIEIKVKGIEDLEEKENSKNQERSMQLEATQKKIKDRNDAISVNNEKLNVLSAESVEAQKELDGLNEKFEKMKKTIFSIADINNAEIQEIEAQQVSKRQKYADIDKQKVSKQEEIKVIESHLEDAEKTLDQLKVELNNNSEKELETTN